MMFDPDPDIIRDITDGYVPQCEKPGLSPACLVS